MEAGSKTSNVTNISADKELRTLLKVFQLSPSLMKDDKDENGWLKASKVLQIYGFERSAEEWSDGWANFKDQVITKYMQNAIMSEVEIDSMKIFHLTDDLEKSCDAVVEVAELSTESPDKEKKTKKKAPVVGHVMTRSLAKKNNAPAGKTTEKSKSIPRKAVQTISSESEEEEETEEDRKTRKAAFEGIIGEMEQMLKNLILKLHCLKDFV